MRKYLKKSNFLKGIFYSITKKEIKFVLIVSAIVMLVSLVPLIYANIIAGPEMEYTGLALLSGPDKMQYLSQIEQARQGKLLLSNLYNTDFGSFEIFSPLRLIMGWFGRITSLSNLAVFHLSLNYVLFHNTFI